MAGALVAAALLATPAGRVAAESAATSPSNAPTEAIAREAGVSTSPEDHASATLPTGRAPRPMRVVDDDPPLTRAAARMRVETMSPARWLEHFGPVTVERRE